MPEVSRSALVPYTPGQMYAVVNDVRSYPAFLPWCRTTRVISESSTSLVARLEIKRGGMTQAFTTSNQMIPPSRIDIGLVDGPFSELVGRWTFDAVGEIGCKVALNLRFRFDSRLMSMAIGQVFNTATDRMVDAFCERAEAIYD